MFFNDGCVLHKVGAADGDAYQYKPSQCALFPLEKGDDGRWLVRQWGYDDEDWDLFCLNPKASDNFERLRGANLVHLTAEAIVLDYPHLFDSKAIAIARKRLGQ